MLPSTVAPSSICGVCRLTTSPPTRAPERSTTLPLNTTTSSPTVPVISVRPLNTTSVSLTVPAMSTSPLKTTAVLAVSPSGTTRPPVRITWSSLFAPS